MVVAAEEHGGDWAAPPMKPKKGSVFPAKRKLVKTMMFEQILNCFKEAFAEKKKQKINHVSVFPIQ
ncbi:hypothetical protein CASFOL_021846 [Castilleja foliolosa]|uniref:Uncharacterized protein n=1 Tax=Castilleja foliolosa TaxID=1961234 RepID=A0ABD3CZA5_9LAMI